MSKVYADCECSIKTFLTETAEKLESRFCSCECKLNSNSGKLIDSAIMFKKQVLRNFEQVLRMLLKEFLKSSRLTTRGQKRFFSFLWNNLTTQMYAAQWGKNRNHAAKNEKTIFFFPNETQPTLFKTICRFEFV